jgi:putative glycosyltransferase
VTPADGAPPTALSIVTTLYRSAGFIDEFHARATRAAAALTSDYELVFVNDGSPDDSLARAVALYERDPHVRVIDLSRNFGHHKAIMTGLAHVRGDLVFLVDVDLEEEPEWLAEFEAMQRRTGADVVYGVQETRKGHWFERLSGALFYKSFNALLDHPIPENVVTARLMTRRYVDNLVLHRDREINLAALWVITGFHQVGVGVRKGNRAGTTYTIGHRISVFVNAVTSYSNKPLVYIFYLGCVIMAVSATYGIVLVWRATHGEVGVPGWASLIVSIWFLGGVMIFCLGLIGVYLSKVFTETKERPYTVIRAEYEHPKDTRV